MRRVFTFVGIAGLLVCVLACLMCGYALLCDVHCVSCDRDKLTAARVVFWEHWLTARNVIILVGAGLTLVALPFALDRRYSAVALMLTVVLGMFAMQR